MLLNVFWYNVVTNFNNLVISWQSYFDWPKFWLKSEITSWSLGQDFKIFKKCTISPGLMDSVEPNVLLFFSQDLWHWHFQEVTKKTELSERQVLRWLRRRGKQDSPSTMQKFTECRSVLHILEPSLSNLTSSPSNLISSHKQTLNNHQSIIHVRYIWIFSKPINQKLISFLVISRSDFRVIWGFFRSKLVSKEQNIFQPFNSWFMW